MLACGHQRAAAGAPICEHLRRHPVRAHVRWYTGAGLDTEWICEACRAERVDGGPTAVEAVCGDCFDEIEDGSWTVGVGGAPEKREAPEAFDAELRETVLPKTLSPVVDVAPVAGLPRVWLALGEDGGLCRIDLSSGEALRVATSNVPPEPDHQPWGGKELRRRLHVSRDGRFAAVVHDYGRNGDILDLTTGQTTSRLDGGTYLSRTVPFSFAFVPWGARVAALHRTDWNRLDVTDAATGELMTPRGPTTYQRGEDRPPHYLDSFHGALRVNPSGTRAAVDGWIWHPVGVIRTWSLAAWVGNVWESEDGPSKLNVCFREHYWDHAMTWLDDDLLVVGGIGDDEDWIVAGARVFDVTRRSMAQGPWWGDAAREVHAFAGPSGVFFGDSGVLFSSDGEGLSRWDPTIGARTGFVPGFRPDARHPGSRELVERVDDRVLRWLMP